MEIFMRAINGIRTRDPQLGKLMLYQLSYYRMSWDCKDIKYLSSYKFFHSSSF